LICDEPAEVFPEQDEDQDLWSLLTHASYFVFRARELELKRYDLTPEQARLLFLVVASQNRATETDLCSLMLREPGSVSKLIERMAVRGLVSKVKDLKPNNLVRVIITPKGLDAYDCSLKRGPIHRIMQGLVPAEKEKLKYYLTRLFTSARHEARLKSVESGYLTPARSSTCAAINKKGECFNGTPV
jgi:DNA-binding MarR family transcriptional regulator